MSFLVQNGIENTCALVKKKYLTIYCKSPMYLKLCEINMTTILVSKQNLIIISSANFDTVVPGFWDYQKQLCWPINSSAIRHPVHTFLMAFFKVSLTNFCMLACGLRIIRL